MSLEIDEEADTTADVAEEVSNGRGLELEVLDAIEADSRNKGMPQVTNEGQQVHRSQSHLRVL